MKKLLAILLALTLCLGLALAEAVDVTGVWYLNEVISGEIAVNPDLVGMAMTITLNADGTASGDVMGEKGEGTWAMDGVNVVVTLEGDALTLTVEGDNLVVDNSADNRLVFGREKIDAKPTELAEVNTGAVMADYNGSWSATVVDMMGLQLPVADLGMSMVITVADGTVTLTEGLGEEAEVTEGTATVENGALCLLAEGDAEPLVLQLRVDGMMTFTEMAEDGVSMGIYFEKIVEAE